jgi:hypothetical protein
MAKNQIDITIRAFNHAKKELDVLNKQLGKLDKEGKKADKSIGMLGKAIAGIGFAAAAKQAAQFVFEATKLAARVETLGVVTQTLGRNAGYTGTEITKFERDVQKLGITTQASRQSLALMMQAQLDLADSTDLARLAQDAAVIAGVNSSEAFQRLINVITSGNVRMARTMGMQVDFNKGYQEMAVQLGKTVEELTAQEKAQSRANTVMAEGAQIAGAYENAMDSVGKQLDSTARFWEEYRVALGEANTEGLGAVNLWWQKQLQVSTDNLRLTALLTEATELGTVTEERAREIANESYFVMSDTKDLREELTKGIDAYRLAQEEALAVEMKHFNALLLATRGYLELGAAIDGVTVAQGTMLSGRGLTGHERFMAAQRAARGYVSPQIGTGITAQAEGGLLSNISLVGEEGFELIIGGVVIPHAESKKLMRLGLVPNESFQGGGFPMIPGWKPPPTGNAEARARAAAAAREAGASREAGTARGGRTTRGGTIPQSSTVPSASKTTATAQSAAATVGVQMAQAITSQTSVENRIQQGLLAEMLAELKLIPKQEDLETAFKTAVEQALY